MIEFIGLIESGYNDLKSLSLESEMCNSNMVSIIESKLPKNLAHQWFRHIHEPDTKVDRKNKFLGLLDFLRIERKALEYAFADLRLNSDVTHGRINALNSDTNDQYNSELVDKEKNSNRHRNNSTPLDNCLVHNVNSHKTVECRKFIDMPLDEKYKLLRDKFACYGCLIPGHSAIDCVKRSPCTRNNCDRLHHEVLHPPEKSTVNNSLNSYTESTNCLLQVMPIPIKSRKMGNLNVFWDSGATVSLITNNKAIEHGLKGTPVTLRIITVGGIERKENSFRYLVPLIDVEGRVRNIVAYGINCITNDLVDISLNNIKEKFHGVDVLQIREPEGSVDLLVGFEYAAWHPIVEQAKGQLLLLSNIFGKCFGGNYSRYKSESEKDVVDISVSHVSLSEFFTIESMGVNTDPKCGGCRCGKCAVGGKNYTLKEERELALIKSNLKFVDHWEVIYPWIKDPKCLPNNKTVAMKKLVQTERRLANQEDVRIKYMKQMDDMVERKIARKLTEEELREYQGPIHYIAHHAVINDSSKTTPMRIVFNSSANYKGHILNEYWGKGPDAFINNLLGILIRFREDYVGFVGDISKMYNSVFTSLLDQHCHRYLWRNMELNRETDTYVITAVNMGDRPSGNGCFNTNS